MRPVPRPLPREGTRDRPYDAEQEQETEESRDAKRLKEMPMRQKVSTPAGIRERSWQEKYEGLSCNVKNAVVIKLPQCPFCLAPSKTGKYARLVALIDHPHIHECNCVMCPECVEKMKAFHLTKPNGKTTNMKCPMCSCEVLTHYHKFYQMDHALNELVASLPYGFCDYGCGMFLHREDVDEHFATCEKNRFECGFSVDIKRQDGSKSKTGCSYTGRKADVEAHMKRCAYYHEACAVLELKEKAKQADAVKERLMKEGHGAREDLRMLLGFTAEEMDNVMERLVVKELDRVGQLPCASSLPDGGQAFPTDSEIQNASFPVLEVSQGPSLQG
eukprot:jgi/Mesvir1/18124/Mv09422-RA.1